MKGSTTNELLLRQSLPYMVAMGLHTPPFLDNADNTFFFSFPLFSQRLHMLRNLATGFDYLVLVIGEKGCGKTVFLEKFLAETKSNWLPCKIRCYASITVDIIFDRIANLLGIKEFSADNKLAAINDHLADLRQKNIVPILLLDDAHELRPDVLLSVCQLGATGDTRRNAQILAFSEPQINSTLATIDPQLPRQAVLNKLFIQAFNESQTAAYIKHRLFQAGLTKNNPLNSSCITEIHKLSGGFPGAINEETHKLLLYNITTKKTGPFEPRPKDRKSLLKKIAAIIPSISATDDHDEGLYKPGWLLDQNPGRFTLQILSTSKENVIHKLVKNHDLAPKAVYYHTFYKGKNWYTLTYGIFESPEAAEKAIQNLPQEIRENAPWVRSLLSVHDAIKNGKRFADLKK
jgi:type II secretory pathway predicted ATPase ExeA